MFMRKVSTPADVARVLDELLDDELAEIAGTVQARTVMVLFQRTGQRISKNEVDPPLPLRPHEAEART